MTLIVKEIQAKTILLQIEDLSLGCQSLHRLPAWLLVLLCTLYEKGNRAPGTLGRIR